MNKPKILTIKFPDAESMKRFSSWMDNSGEQGFFWDEEDNCAEEDKPVTEFVYSKDGSLIVAKY